MSLMDSLKNGKRIIINKKTPFKTERSYYILIISKFLFKETIYKFMFIKHL